MTQLVQKISRKRELTKEQINAFTNAVDKFDALIPRLRKYESDEFIVSIYNDLAKQIKDMEAAKDEYLQTPIEDIKTYDINEEDIEEVKQAILNFKKLVALK